MGMTQILRIFQPEISRIPLINAGDMSIQTSVMLSTLPPWASNCFLHSAHVLESRPLVT